MNANEREKLEEVEGYLAASQHGDMGHMAVQRIALKKVRALLEAEEESGAKTWPTPEMLEAAWGIIANAYGGSWEHAPDDWRKAAEEWRDAYTASAPEPEPEEGERCEICEVEGRQYCPTHASKQGEPDQAFLRAIVEAARREALLAVEERIDALEKWAQRAEDRHTSFQASVERRLHHLSTPAPDTSLRCHKCGELRTEMQPCLCEPDSEPEPETVGQVDHGPDRPLTEAVVKSIAEPERDEGGERNPEVPAAWVYRYRTGSEEDWAQWMLRWGPPALPTNYEVEKHKLVPLRSRPSEEDGCIFKLDLERATNCGAASVEAADSNEADAKWAALRGLVDDYGYLWCRALASLRTKEPDNG